MSDSKKKIMFGTYQIRKKLGEGAFGEIYLANNINDNSEYALKI